MASVSTAPKLDPEEAAALEQLSRVDAAVRARPTPRVVQAVRELAGHAEREFAESRRKLCEALDRIHASTEAGGLPALNSDEEEVVQRLRIAACLDAAEALAWIAALQLFGVRWNEVPLLPTVPLLLRPLLSFGVRGLESP